MPYIEIDNASFHYKKSGSNLQVILTPGEFSDVNIDEKAAVPVDGSGTHI